MDVQHVYQTLEATLSPDAATRQAAEEALKQFSNQQGYLACLFQLVGSSQVPFHIRQAGATFLKNQVSNFFSSFSIQVLEIINLIIDTKTLGSTLTGS